MSGLLRRLRASSDATPRAGDAVPDAAPASEPAAAGADETPAAEPTEAPAEDTAATDDTPAADSAAEPAPAGDDATPPSAPTMVLTPGDPLAQRAATREQLPATTGEQTQLMPITEPSVAAAPAAPAAPAGPALPAGTDGPRPDTRRRGRLRRRLRHVRHVRELMLRDVGGLAYEIYRADDASATEHGRMLVQGKLEALRVLDAERHDLEAVLGDARGTTILREPGIGGTCPACGEYFASDARFCSRCGTRVDGRTDPSAPTLAAPEPEAAAPTDGLWAGGQPAPSGAVESDSAPAAVAAPAAAETEPAKEAAAAEVDEAEATSADPPAPDAAAEATPAHATPHAAPSEDDGAAAAPPEDPPPTEARP